MRKSLFKQKTTWIGLGAIAAAVGHYLELLNLPEGTETLLVGIVGGLALIACEGYRHGK